MFRSVLMLLALFALEVQAQPLDSLFADALSYRFVGPYRGGRSTAVAGVPSQPYTFYMGSTGGGVWKTDDAGMTWKNISDGQIRCGSIGSISVAPSAPYVVYVGTGSDSPRGNVSPGIGLYKSIDSGKTWEHKGLELCGQIGDIVVHPTQPDLLFVAALGNIFQPNKERGVYRSTDGGDSWEHVLYLSDTVGAVDLALHPSNPNIIYAGMWRAERKPWTMIDGGNEGGLYRTLDRGTTWQKIENGLPDGVIGKIGVTISPANPDRIWVIQQAADEEKGGVYRSDDGGDSFRRICRDHKLRQRGWYYTRIFADPQDENTVYVTNTGFYKSIDGGEHFDHRYIVPHGDNHDVWIHPDHPEIMINSNDGGANVTLNGGQTWSPQTNQPTAEFYRLTVDHQFPYRLYAGQQDNTTISVPSRSSGGIHPKQVWYAVGGGESADVAVHPQDPNIIYATTYSGIITRVNLATNERSDIGAYPHYTEGTQTRDLKYRWQWNFPIRISQHDPNVIYHTSNYVHRSTDEGKSWTIISPDLTRDIDAYHDIPGGPVQHDGTGVEIYSTIFSFAESASDPNTIWVGSDDGMIHITRDGGNQWQDITPSMIPREGTVNDIKLSPHADGTAWVAVYHYRMGDFKPYVLQTKDYGRKWTLLTDGNGIPEDHFVRTIAEDTEVPGLLFAGTEFGLYVSHDHGGHWQPLQLNLPHTPITDMEVHQGDLVMSTQGRGFWILDALNVIRQWRADLVDESLHLFQPEDTYRSNLGGFGGTAPPRSPYRADLYVYLADDLDTSQTLSLVIQDMAGDTVRRWASDLDARQRLKVQAGLNRVSWDLTLAAPTIVKDLVMMDMRYPGQGPKAVPGTYRATLSSGAERKSVTFGLAKDPRWQVTNDDLKANLQLALAVRDLITRSQEQIMNLRGIRRQAGVLHERLSRPQKKRTGPAIQALIQQTKTLEEMIFQTKIETSQDEINYPRKLTNHLIRLYRVVISQNDRPSQGELERWADLQKAYEPFAQAYEDFLAEDLSGLIEQMKAEGIPAIISQ